MRSTIALPTPASAFQSWSEANERDLDLELQRLRLLLRRRVLWLRQQWKHDPLQNYQPLVISDAQADALLAGEDRHAEMHFYEENSEAAATSHSIAHIEKALQQRRQIWIDAQCTSALDTLARLFGLTVFERKVLMLCLAPELDPAFERLYAYAQDDVTRKYATPHLALTLFGGDSVPGAKRESDRDPSNFRNSFLPEASLRRFHLVNLEQSPSSGATSMTRPLRLDERLLDYLRGINQLDERVADLLRPLGPALLAPPHQELLEQLLRSQQWTNRGPWAPLNLVGPRGAGKRAVARAICDRLGLRVYELEAKRLPTPPTERQNIVRLLEREIVLMQAALYLEATESHGTDGAPRDAISEVIDRLSAFYILGSRERWPTDRQIVVAPVTRPDATAQRALWEGALARVPHSLNGQVESIVEQFNVAPSAILQAIAAAQSRSSLRNAKDGSEITADDLWHACRDVARKQLDDLAQRIISCYTWDDIVLPDDVFCQLREIAAQVAHRYQVYECWGFGRRLSRGRGVTALFSGSSGTGKTMAAEIVANHLSLDLYRIDLAGVVNKYIGETEKNLRRVFDVAEQSGAILFFDEADALFGKRTEVKDSHDRYANIEVNYLLQRMEDYRGLAILATNRRSALDRAFLRRLRFLVDFPSPDANNRRAIWQKVFPQEAKVERLDFDGLARLEIPGGNIRNIAINAAFLAAGDGASIGMTHVMRAARREYAKIDKLLTPAEFGRYYEIVRS
jgi:Winged helix domain, variant/ATPase family associated with various cellular activities (AAA)